MRSKHSAKTMSHDVNHCRMHTFETEYPQRRFGNPRKSSDGFHRRSVLSTSKRVGDVRSERNICLMKGGDTGCGCKFLLSRPLTKMWMCREKHIPKVIQLALATSLCSTSNPLAFMSIYSTSPSVQEESHSAV